jgi:hypothetical protein
MVVKTLHTKSPSNGGTGVSPVQAQTEVCGYPQLFFDRNLVSEREAA